jgi:CheY-like chemotaxis protein
VRPSSMPTRPIPKMALLAEDNPTVREVIAAVVSRLGFEVTAVTDGATAQARLFASPPDLLVVDIGLPTVSGTLLIRTLKALKWRAKAIAISGSDLETEALAAGADAFLSKPFVDEDLERAVRELF